MQSAALKIGAVDSRYAAPCVDPILQHLLLHEMEKLPMDAKLRLLLTEFSVLRYLVTIWVVVCFIF
jgi:hypothetical protein